MAEQEDQGGATIIDLNAGEDEAQRLEDVQARIRGIDAAQEKQRGEKVLGWWDEVALLTPLASVTEEIEGHQLTFVCPKFGRWLAALPHLQAVYNAGRQGHEGENPLAMLFFFLRSWDAPSMLQQAGEHLGQILDLFQGQQAGWTAENFGPQSVARMVRNYLLVIPVEELKRFFGESVGALKGQATAGKGKEGDGAKGGA